ncbi:MAG: periplasmic heavy metal sensor [Candidatus Eisenbacteria bacterium]|nr:periplasmic heavy metal sensor [Candidatus Eisenbacteria bacterium]
MRSEAGITRLLCTSLILALLGLPVAARAADEEASAPAAQETSKTEVTSPYAPQRALRRGMMRPQMMRSGMMGRSGMMPSYWDAEPGQDASQGASLLGGGMLGSGLMACPLFGHHMQLIDRLWELDLSRKQRDRIVEIYVDVRKRVWPMQADVQVRLLEARELLLTADPPTERIEAKLAEVCDQRTAVTMLWVHALIDARKVLTPEQEDHFLDPSW